MVSVMMMMMMMMMMPKLLDASSIVYVSLSAHMYILDRKYCKHAFLIISPCSCPSTLCSILLSAPCVFLGSSCCILLFFVLGSVSALSPAGLAVVRLSDALTIARGIASF